MKKIFLIFLLYFGLSYEETSVITQRYNTGEKKMLVVYKEYGLLDEEIVKRYTFDTKGNVKKFEDLQNPNNYFIKNPHLLTAKGLQVFLNGFWAEQNTNEYLQFTADSIFAKNLNQRSAKITYKNYCIIVVEEDEIGVLDILNDSTFVVKDGPSTIYFKRLYND